MSGYVRNTKFEGEFEGDKVTAVLAPLKFQDVLSLESLDIDENDKDAADREVSKVLAEILPKYVVQFDGLKDADGQPVAIDEVCSSAYFASLSMQIGRKLLEAAYPQRPKTPGVPSAS